MTTGIVRTLQTRTRILLNETLPVHVHTVIRLSLGIIYVWFGLLKFSFIPGGSPAGPLIAAWRVLLPTDSMMFGLALFETAMGVLLLLGWKVRLVAAILLVHVLGTFATMLLAADQIFNLRHGLYSLTLAGELIVKNLLLVAGFFALAATRPRRHPRWPFIVPGMIRAGEQSFAIMTQNVSLTGLSFFCPAEAESALKAGDRVSLGIAVPLDGRQLQLKAKIVHLGGAPESMLLVGCELENPGGLIELLAPWLSDETGSVARAVGAALRVETDERN
jgi:putative oxidoreductase